MNPRENGLTRRDLLKAGATAGAAIAIPIFLPGCAPETSKWPPSKENWPRGAFADIDNNGTLIITPEPVAVEIQPIAPKRTNDTSDTLGRIYVFRIPSHEKLSHGENDPQLLYPSNIQTDYVVRVLGDKIVDGTNYKVRDQNGIQHEVGIWYMFVDNPNDKNPVNPYTGRVISNISPFFIDEKSGIVIKPQEEKIITLEELKPTGIYNGVVTIVKQPEINGKTTLPKTRTSTVTESDDNVIDWSKIVSLNGVPVEKKNSFFVENPYTSNGRNPTGDRSQPSTWLAFIADIVVNNKPRRTKKTVLYINMSAQTSDLAIPDTKFWTQNIIPISVVDNKPFASDNTKLPSNIGVVKTEISAVPPISGK